MKITVIEVDHAPDELHDQLPLIFNTVKELKGNDNNDYFIAQSKTPIKWIHNNDEKNINYSNFD